MMLDLSSLPVSISKLKPNARLPVAHGTALQVATVVLHVTGLSVRTWQSPSRAGGQSIAPLPGTKVRRSGCSCDHLLASLSPPGKIHLCVHLAQLHHCHPVTPARKNWFHHWPTSMELTLWRDTQGIDRNTLCKSQVWCPHLKSLQPSAGLRG